MKGEVEDEILVSTHTCHPSLANDNLSGMATAVYLAKRMRERKLHHTFRFLFIPGTIGSITWLALNEAHVHRIKHALVITGVGDTGPFTYKRSRRGNAAIDRVAPRVLAEMGEAHKVIDFYPYGYDERQSARPASICPADVFRAPPTGNIPSTTRPPTILILSRFRRFSGYVAIDSILVTADRDRFLVSRSVRNASLSLASMDFIAR